MCSRECRYGCVHPSLRLCVRPSLDFISLYCTKYSQELYHSYLIFSKNEICTNWQVLPHLNVLSHLICPCKSLACQRVTLTEVPSVSRSSTSFTMRGGGTGKEKIMGFRYLRLTMVTRADVQHSY